MTAECMPARTWFAWSWGNGTNHSTVYESAFSIPPTKTKARTVMTNQQRFQRLYPGSEDAYGQHDSEGIRTETVKGATSETRYETHLEGEGLGLGIIPIRKKDNTVRWAALDLDDKTVDHKALARKVEDLGLPAVVLRSRNGGAHITVFFTDDVPAALAIKKLEQLSEDLGLKNPDGRPIEVFPSRPLQQASS